VPLSIPSLRGGASARVIHQDLAHHPGGDGEEVEAVADIGLSTREAQVCFIDEIGRAKRMIRAFAAQVAVGNPA
jgi:hypothetical protein